MVDLLIAGGTVITMDDDRSIVEDGAVAVDKGRIVDVGRRHDVEARVDARQRVDANGMAVLPGLIDTHGHAGHTLTKTIGETRKSTEWFALMDKIYFGAATLDFWRADGLLNALERLKFGTTTGMAILGAQPRSDSPIYAGATAQGYRDVGVRGIVALGVPRPPWPRTMTSWQSGSPVDCEIPLTQGLATAEEVINDWHGEANGRIFVYLMASVLMPSAETWSRASADEVSEDDRNQAEGLIELATKYDTAIHAHCYDDMIRRAYNANLGILGPKLSLAHCTGINDEDIRILSATGATVCHAPNTRSFIKSRCPVPELIEEDVTVGLATDGTSPDRSFDMFASLKSAMMTQRIHFADPRYMPAGKVLEMATVDAAATLGLQDTIGSLTPGKQADIILIRARQPHLTPWFMVPHRIAYEATGHDVDTVIVAGQVVMAGRKVLSVDEEAILEFAQAEAEAMVSRAGIQSELCIPDRFWGHSRY